MPSHVAEKAREFAQRYRQLSQDAGYHLVYATFDLLRELIPYWEINFILIRPKNASARPIQAGSVPLWLASPKAGRTQNKFFPLADRVDFVQCYCRHMIECAGNDRPMLPYSFADHPQHSKGHQFFHHFYRYVNAGDVILQGHLLDRHQVLEPAPTANYYVLICALARQYGEENFTEAEKHLLSLCVDIFAADFKNKVQPSGSCPFRPQLTGEILDGKTRWEDIFNTGNRYKPRELATIKACFDLQQTGQTVNLANVARHLHLPNDEGDGAALKKAKSWVSYDLDKIKSLLFTDFKDNPAEQQRLKNEFGLQHITDVFRSYAYFGLYPDPNQQRNPVGNHYYISYLSEKLDKWRRY